MKPQWIGVLAGMLIPLAGLAAQEPVETIAATAAGNPAEAAGAICEREYQALPYGTILDLLDPEAPAERRASALETYERLATIKECPEFAYTLGQLYRHGPDLPGNPLAQDVPRARELIRPMAEEAGYIGAFADLLRWRCATRMRARPCSGRSLPASGAEGADGSADPDRPLSAFGLQRHLLTRVELIWNCPGPVPSAS